MFDKYIVIISFILLVPIAFIINLLRYLRNINEKEINKKQSIIYGILIYYLTLILIIFILYLWGLFDIKKYLIDLITSSATLYFNQPVTKLL